MKSLLENLLITVVGGVAVMAIWSAMQKKAADKKAANWKTSGGDQFKPVSENTGVVGYGQSGGVMDSIIDLLDTKGREYQI